jgi:hypothetical protein
VANSINFKTKGKIIMDNTNIVTNLKPYICLDELCKTTDRNLLISQEEYRDLVVRSAYLNVVITAQNSNIANIFGLPDVVRIVAECLKCSEGGKEPAACQGVDEDA